MSYVDPSQDPNLNDDENKSQVDLALSGNSQDQTKQNQPDVAPPATSGGGGSGVVTGGGVGGSAATGDASGGSAKPSTSGSWTNLNSYLDANKDQGAAVGSQIADTVGKQGSSANDEIQGLSTGFNKAVQDNTVNEDSGAVQQALSSASGIKAGQALSQPDIDAFNRQANASYSGPTDFTQFDGYSKAAQDAQAAKQTAQQTQSESGRDVLLQNQFKNASANGYTQGENNLDQLLLEGSGGAQQISQAAQPWSNLNDVLNQNVTSGNAAAQAAIATTKQTGANTLSAFNTARNNSANSVEQALAAAKAGYSTDYNKLVGDLNSYSSSGNLNLSAQEAAMLGLTQDQRIYNLYQESPTLGTSYLQQQAFDPNREITADQQAQLAALDQLGLGAHQTATNKYTNASLAGTQNGQNSVDTSMFNQALANANNTFQGTTGTDVAGYGGIEQDNARAYASEDSTVANYLAGGSPNIVYGHGPMNVSGIGPNGEDANTWATELAQDAYWKNLMAQLQTTGYNNQVKVT